MARKRISQKEARMIANERIQVLLNLAEEQALCGNIERGRRYVQLARRIGMRTNTRMPRKFLYCKDCLSPLIPGKNCTVRLRSNHVTTTCNDCGHIRRHPYLAEKRRLHE
ncbi:MAG TPA: ribonuclease P protein component 4 [Methanomassiliicoccales archaeon]|nr:ribonuclease P protein component 4 [Methanomassiliicoccales archaeon]